MSADPCDEAEDILSAALDAEPSERPAILDARTAGRPELRAEVESLLGAVLEAGAAFLASPAAPPPGAPASASGPAADDGPSPGTSIGPYRIVEMIGEGGMAKVFRAERADGEFSHEIAIKIIAGPSAADARRFRAERQILASLQHPHIVTLIDGGTLPSGRAYLAMEYVRGTAITEYCRARRLGLEDRLRLFLHVALAVGHAHEHHVVHRDIKPSNVMVTAEGTPKVLDFGIAKLLDESAGEGAAAAVTIPGFGPLTPNYASPEQLRGLPVTAAADIYSMGVLLYEILAGVRPYETTRKPLDEVLQMVLKGGPRPPSVAVESPNAGRPYSLGRLRGALDAVVVRAMAVSPGARYGSVEEMAADLRRVLGDGQAAARSWGAMSWSRRVLLALASAALLLVTVADGVNAPAPRPTGAVQTGRASFAARRGGTRNAGAWEAYAGGQRIWRTRTGLAGAIAAYRKAVAIDPDFALAHVALADAYAAQVSPSPEAERELAEALRIDPELGEAHASRGFIRMFHHWDWEGAEASLTRAVALAPEYAEAHHWLGCYLTLVRRFDEARASLERAAGLDPDSPLVALDLGRLAYYAGEDASAARYCEQARAAGDQAHQASTSCLAHVYERLGRYREAWEIDEWHLGWARPSQGDLPQRLRGAARQWVERAVAHAGGEAVGLDLVNPNLAFSVAQAYARLGDRANMLKWLSTGIAWRAFPMPYINVEPTFDPFRSDAEFRQLLSRMRLSAN